MPEPMPEPVAAVESTDERLRRLEFMVASLHPGLAPDGYAPAVPAQTQAGVIPLSLMVNAVLPEEGRRRFFHDLPVLRELRLIAQMYLDPRYRLSRVAQLGVPAILILAVMNYVTFNLLFPSIPFLSPIIERLFLLVFGAILAVLLSREAIRYQAVIDYLARAGRS